MDDDQSLSDPEMVEALLRSVQRAQPQSDFVNFSHGRYAQMQKRVVDFFPDEVTLKNKLDALRGTAFTYNFDFAKRQTELMGQPLEPAENARGLSPHLKAAASSEAGSGRERRSPGGSRRTNKGKLLLTTNIDDSSSAREKTAAQRQNRFDSTPVALKSSKAAARIEEVAGKRKPSRSTVDLSLLGDDDWAGKSATQEKTRRGTAEGQAKVAHEARKSALEAEFGKTYHKDGTLSTHIDREAQEKMNREEENTTKEDLLEEAKRRWQAQATHGAREKLSYQQAQGFSEGTFGKEDPRKRETREDDMALYLGSEVEDVDDSEAQKLISRETNRSVRPVAYNHASFSAKELMMTRKLGSPNSSQAEHQSHQRDAPESSIFGTKNDHSVTDSPAGSLFLEKRNIDEEEEGHEEEKEKGEEKEEAGVEEKEGQEEGEGDGDGEGEGEGQEGEAEGKGEGQGGGQEQGQGQGQGERQEEREGESLPSCVGFEATGVAETKTLSETGSGHGIPKHCIFEERGSLSHGKIVEEEDQNGAGYKEGKIHQERSEAKTAFSSISGADDRGIRGEKSVGGSTLSEDEDSGDNGKILMHQRHEWSRPSSNGTIQDLRLEGSFLSNIDTDARQVKNKKEDDIGSEEGNY